MKQADSSNGSKGKPHPRRPQWLMAGLCISALLGAALDSRPATAQPLRVEVTEAQVAYDQRTNEPLITFKMTDQSREAFRVLTTENVGKVLEIRIDGRVIMRPVVREPITGGSGQIAGNLNATELKDLAARLMAGSAKLEFEAMPR